MIYLWNRIFCFFKGHSHPVFTCCYCGSRSPLHFKDGSSKMSWRGRGWGRVK